jgi:cytochrome c5
MNMASKVLMLTFAALLSTPLYSQDAAPKATLPHAAGMKKLASTVPHENEGQRIFDQQCSRCHNAPEGFSPRISGTIVRHMRVRASLSQHEEAELLRFFNP